MSESDLIGTPPGDGPKPAGKGRGHWSGGDYLVFAAFGAFIAGLVASVAASSGSTDFATFVLIAGSALFGSWWLIGCAAIGVRVALRERDEAP